MSLRLIKTNMLGFFAQYVGGCYLFFPLQHTGTNLVQLIIFLLTIVRMSRFFGTERVTKGRKI